MKELKLVSNQLPKHAYKRATAAHPAIPNTLGREFNVSKPNQVWCGDITYSVPGVQGKHGCLNEPRVYLKYTNKTAGANLFVTKPGCAGIGV